MKIGTLLGTIVASAAAMGLGSCVGILRHDPLVPDRLGAERALEAARRSSFIQGRERLRVVTQQRIATMPGGIVGPLTPARPTDKVMGRARLADAPIFWVAGLVRDGAFAMLTTEPGPDIAPYHDRQIVLLRPDAALDWLDLRKPEAELLRALPEGSLSVEKVFPEAA